MGRIGSAAKPKRNSPSQWAKLADDQLLATPLRDLKLSLEGTWLADCLRDLNAELDGREIVLRAHGWISDEWFSPPETPGIAFPFYLAHPRLMRLERKMMLEVEGGTRRECMRILRHEAGHVVQHAYALHRRRRWQTLFGRASQPYPEHYRANPTSKNYVQYLRRWYAQCHPDEDFAETFAVWLTPRYNWRKRYAGWPALEKLIYVNELMEEIAGEKPPPVKRTHVDPLSKLHGTLGEHYEHKRERYAVDSPTVFDRDLRRVFSDEPRHASAPLAAAVIRRHRTQVIRSVSRWTGEYPVALEAALDDMINRCRALKLRAPGNAQQIRLELTAMLSSKAVFTQYSSSRRQWFAV
ncbi:MAG: putative zinc-binding metallopeptidase [Hyphomonadaceae bacterium]